jgi:hypothetical protein
MPNSQSYDHQFIVPNLNCDSVISDSVSPLVGLRAGQPLSFGSWLAGLGDYVERVEQILGELRILASIFASCLSAWVVHSARHAFG